MNREPSYYLELPYQQVWEWREDDAEPYWVVRLVEIPEVADDGLTIAEPTPRAAAG